jgi:hypothetical protein
MGLLEWTFVLSLFLPPLAVIAGAMSLVARRWITSVRRSDSMWKRVMATH